MDKPPELFKDPKDAEAYAALMRQLPIHSEEDDPDLVAAFKEHEDFLEAMEAPDEDEEEDGKPT
jgi:DNA-binding GntR family transcriptional regulator